MAAAPVAQYKTNNNNNGSQLQREQSAKRKRKRRNASGIMVQIQNWMVNEGRAKIFLTLFLLAQVGYFAQSYFSLMSAANLATFRSVLSAGLGTARGAANVINFLCALILFTVCRNLISGLRSTFLNRIIPFDKNITFHIWIAYSISFWSVVHVMAHYFNYLNVSKALPVSAETLSLVSGPGWTGQVVSVALFLMMTSAMEAVRRNYFEMFWITHHLFIVFFGGLLMHGSFCFIKADSGDPCRGGPTFWKWWIASGVVYLMERIYREYRGRQKTRITKVVQHPGKTIEIQMRKDAFSAKAGQYIFVCVPEISGYEWHPFTLTSSPYEDFFSIHIRVVGDWTTRFAYRLGCRFGDKGEDLLSKPTTLPYIMVDGGFGSASEDVFDYEAAILVGAGIGVTPFASILKDIWYRYANKRDLKELRKVYFIWTARDKDAFEWFQDLLVTLEEENLDHFLEIHAYLTGKLTEGEVKNIFINDGENGKDAITGLRAGTHFGRPNWDQIFNDIRDAHPGADIGVFFCGPKVLSGVLHKVCNKYTQATSTGTRFFYGKENF